MQFLASKAVFMNTLFIKMSFIRARIIKALFIRAPFFSGSCTRTEGRGRSALVVLIASTALLACSELPQTASVTEQKESWWSSGSGNEGGAVVVKRSPGDERAYRYIQLANDLKVLLISDPDADKAAASLNVNIGSFQNSRDREGLAHFLEHMLFLGTDKYPEAGAYQAFISEHGGSHNAYTSMEDTNYFFNIDANYLSAALDRFSRFFVAPRFDKAYVAQERNAVNAEYLLKLKDDSRREWEVLGEQVDPAHPLSQFSVGNLETLADRDGKPVRGDLLAFYKKYYSAELMTLAVLGRESLGQLEALVRAKFAEIPMAAAAESKDDALHSDTRQSDAGQSDTQLGFVRELPFELDIQPVKNDRSLTLAFPVASVKPHWKTKPDVYWAHVLSDESKDSLIADLKRAGLANGLNAGLVFDTERGAMFMLGVDLTPAGVKQKDAIVDRLFAWLNLARQQGLAKWRFDELSALQQTNFRFVDKASPSGYVERLSSALSQYPPQEVVRAGYVLEDFDERVLTDFIAQLTPENAVIIFVAPEVDDTERSSARYAAPYTVKAVSAETRSRWLSATENKLALAPVNPYLAQRYPLSGKGGSAGKPTLLSNQLDTSIWHYSDQQFGSPRSVFEARISTPAVQGCRNTAMTELYLVMIADQLVAQTY